LKIKFKHQIQHLLTNFLSSPIAAIDWVEVYTNIHDHKLDRNRVLMRMKQIFIWF
jgi:hypothetical protein